MRADLELVFSVIQAQFLCFVVTTAEQNENNFNWFTHFFAFKEPDILVIFNKVVLSNSSPGFLKVFP